nr:helix-turn-helix transcriptional regulator [Flavihumibacter fluvii]
MNTWNVATLTNTPHISPHEFQRIFKTIFPVSVNEWLTSQKMFLAANLLLHSQQSIASIGAAIGFSSDSNFTTSFNRHFLTTPALFRKTAHSN